MANNHATTESEMEKRRREGNVRAYMAVRRELREQITKGFKKRIDGSVVSGGALFLRCLVFSLTMGVGLGAGYLGVENYKDLISHINIIEENRNEFRKFLIEEVQRIRGYEKNETNETNETNEIYELYEISEILELVAQIHKIEDRDLITNASFIGLIFRGIVLLLLAFGFVIYSINWLRLAYLDDVRTKRYYESYGNDIERASFAIETILEVGEMETTEVPDAWVEGVCRNLFTDKSDDNYGKMPSNAAAMLFESIAGAKFGPEGTELTMKRRAPRRFPKIARRRLK